MVKFLSTLVTGLIAISSLSANPLGLDTVGPVQAPGSDAQSQAYQAFSPTINSYIGNVSAPFNPTNTGQTLVITDPTNLLQSSAAEVRFYFVNNSAAFNNSLGISSNFTTNPGSAELIFANASVNASNPNPSDPNAPYAALVNGNYVDLGVLAQGTPLNLFIASDAADGPVSGPDKGIFWNSIAQNSDGVDHMKMVQFIGTNYYLIGWEDLPLAYSDRDFNDIFVVVELVPVPEPATYLLMAVMAFIVVAAKRKKMAGAVR